MSNYSDVIAYHFYGHTHKDQVRLRNVVFSCLSLCYFICALFCGVTSSHSLCVRFIIQLAFIHDSNGPTGTMLIAPSITPQGQNNPSVRVFTYDTNSYELLDYVNYAANLTRANIEGKVTFERLYSAKADLGVRDMSTQSWWQLLQSMQTDDSLFQRYYSLYYPAAAPIAPCNAACKLQYLCNAAYVSKSDRAQCVKAGHF